MSDDDLPDDSKPTRTRERWAAFGKFLQASLTALLFGISPALAQDAGTPSADNSPPSLDDAQKVFTAAFEQTCGLDGGDDTLDPPQMFDLDFNYSYDEAGTPPHPLRLFRFFCGIDPEEDLDRLAPVSAVRFGVEQAQIELHVRAVVAGQNGALRRFVHERIVCQIEPRRPKLARVDDLLTLRPRAHRARRRVGTKYRYLRRPEASWAFAGLDLRADKHHSFALV